LQYIGGLM